MTSIAPPRRLRRAELPVETVAMARYLLGRVVVRELGPNALIGRIVETEAYPPGDPGSHCFRGMTSRNRAMYLGRGHAYVYFIYGSSYCLNVTSERKGIGAAVLIRALEPLSGLEVMTRRRGTDRDLTRGPGRLASALGIDRRHDGIDLCAASTLWLGDVGRAPAAVAATTRIGLSRAKDPIFRFFEPENPHVSGPRHLAAGAFSIVHA